MLLCDIFLKLCGDVFPDEYIYAKGQVAFFKGFFEAENL